MDIAIIGATGKVGNKILYEALARQHRVVAIVRNKSKIIHPTIEVIEKDLFNLVRDDLQPFHVVISAFNTPVGQESLHLSAMQHYINLLTGTTIRLLVVGGSGSLYLDDRLSQRLVDCVDFPPMHKAAALFMADALELLKNQSSINWTYICPPLFFNPFSQRRGCYCIGRDQLLFNKHGQSSISYADYAIAVIDEAERANYLQQRFTVVAD